MPTLIKTSSGMSFALPEPPINMRDLLLEDVRAASGHPLYAALTPRSHRLLTTRPHRHIARNVRRLGSLFLPQQRQAHAAEWGILAVILRVAADCDPELVPGRQVLIGQFAGVPVFDFITSRNLDLWLVGEGDVMAVIEGEEMQV